jgi:N-acetylglucosamine-6-phosphate deacetylase
MPAEKVLFIRNGTVILRDRLLEDGALLCRGGLIAAVGPRRDLAPPEGAKSIDAGGGFIAPGFVDIHVHGGGGADFMDGTRQAVSIACRTHARHGTTSIFPTTTTGSPAQLTAMLNACKSAASDWRVQDGARVAGVHFYGPYFAEDKIGAHPPHGRRNPDAREYTKYFDLKIIRIATCAAELPGAEEFYHAAREAGCLITCGHSNASWSEMDRAFRAGMRHVDHFWSAMSTVPSIRQRFGTPVQGSMEQFVLRHEAMSTEVIADGMHLSPELLEFALSMKGPQRLCLVTDANRAVDMPPGRYRIGNENDGEWFESDGKVGFQTGGGLASSVVGMNTMIWNMHKLAGASLPQAVRMGSLTPAERAGLAEQIGSLEPGKHADVVILGSGFNVQRVFMGGDEFQS